MNDTPDLFGELDGFEPTTIRPATPSDSRALDALRSSTTPIWARAAPRG